MSYVQRFVAHCDVCGHEWLIVGGNLLAKSGIPVKVPSHCAKCKSRKWNQLAAAAAHVMSPEEREEQRRSFAYGNVAMHNPNVTREIVDRAADALAARANPHDPKTCRTYKCGMCAAIKEQP
jgi:hypothetical protein